MIKRNIESEIKEGVGVCRILRWFFQFDAYIDVMIASIHF